jgi:aspartate ammonia-lyase
VKRFASAELGRESVLAEVRIEHDSLGAVEVPHNALYGAHTARAVDNFRVSGFTLGNVPDLLDGLIRVKIAAARANREAREVAPEVADAIVCAGREVLDGHWRDQFPVDVVQGGGGTATNMNVNEVLANRAAEFLGGVRGMYDRVHPNDHVNRCQSTNDVYPTALHLAVLSSGARAVAEFSYLARTFERKATEFGGLTHIGRTCIQDALPVTVGDTHRSHAYAVDRAIEDLQRTIVDLHAVPLGATVLGTGFGAGTAYRELVIHALSDETAMLMKPSANPFDALSHCDPLLAVASALTRVVLVIAQTAQDLRMLCSGPTGGLGEVLLPSVQVGSSAMPGKVNPVIPELVLQVAFEVRGARQTIEAAVAAGEFELNVMEPVIAKHLLTSMRDAGRMARLFADRCVAGLSWDEARVHANLAGSYADAMVLAATAGYDAASNLAQRNVTAQRAAKTAD